MTGEEPPKHQRSEAEIREDRLKRQLKANLARRKRQARGRQSGDADNKTGRDAGGEQEG